MSQIKITPELKKKLIEAIEKGRVSIFYDPRWDYPKDDDPGCKEFVSRVVGGSQKTIPLLDLLFRIERHGGYVLKINDEVLKERKPGPSPVMTKKDMYGDKK